MSQARKRKVRCTMCTQHRWKGNRKGRFKAKEEALKREFKDKRSDKTKD